MIYIVIASVLVGFFLFYLLHTIKTKGFENLAEQILLTAKRDAETAQLQLELNLKQKEAEHQGKLDSLLQKSQEKRAQQKEKLEKRENKIDKQLDLIGKNLTSLEKKENTLMSQQKHIHEKEEKCDNLQKELLNQLEKLSQCTMQEAKSLLLKQLIEQAHLDAAATKDQIKKEAEKQSAKILSTAMNRLALPMASELSTVTIALPNQEIKRRIIGREGRNIRALEQATGVNFMLDDTPNAVVISSLDPLRKEVAKQALKELISDGRIHPTRIEEIVAGAKKWVEKQIEGYGQKAANQVGVMDLHPELMRHLGQLHFCYNSAQNILKHSLEVAYLMGMMAEEMHLDASLAKRIGLLHDIGKASSYKNPGSHALIGQQLALQYGEKEEVANGIGSHHEEILPTTIESALCSCANTISAERPGARIEALEQYMKRAHKLEDLSKQFKGVEKAYALQMGKELRVIVEPDHFDDLSMTHLARDLAKKIEQELSFSGKIKVSVVREKRAVEYAN